MAHGAWEKEGGLTTELGKRPPSFCWEERNLGEDAESKLLHPCTSPVAGEGCLQGPVKCSR